MTEQEKFIYLFNVFNKGILTNNTNQYILDLFDYYLRYLQFTPYIDITIKPKQIKIEIHPELKDSFKTYIKTRNALDNDIEIAPYYKKLTKYNLFDDLAPLFFVENNKGYKNIYLPTYKLRNHIIPNNNPDDYNLSPVFKQINNIIVIKDIWEKK